MRVPFTTCTASGNRRRDRLPSGTFWRTRDVSLQSSTVLLVSGMGRPLPCRSFSLVPEIRVFSQVESRLDRSTGHGRGPVKWVFTLLLSGIYHHLKRLTPILTFGGTSSTKNSFKISLFLDPTHTFFRPCRVGHFF